MQKDIPAVPLKDHQPGQYESAKRTVVCYAQPLANGRFVGFVSVQTHAERSAIVVHKCPGTDMTADDAIVRARAWAHVHYPVS